RSMGATGRRRTPWGTTRTGTHWQRYRFRVARLPGTILGNRLADADRIRWLWSPVGRHRMRFPTIEGNTRPGGLTGPTDWDDPSGRNFASGPGMGREPHVGQQLREPVDRMGRQSLEHILQIGERIAPEPFADADEAIQDRRRPDGEEG